MPEKKGCFLVFILKGYLAGHKTGSKPYGAGLTETFDRSKKNP
jgi:hypothetical protein